LWVLFAVSSSQAMAGAMLMIEWLFLQHPLVHFLCFIFVLLCVLLRDELN